MDIATYINYAISPKKIKDLIEQNIKLSARNESKDRILANISHEIRSPISAIVSLVYLLKDNFSNKVDDECLEYIELIEDASLDTLEFTKDLLDISHLSSGKMDVEMSSKIDLKDLLQKFVTTSNHIYKQNNAKITFSADNAMPKINLDKRRIKQILINLISNSVKYSRELVNIDVRAEFLAKENKILISVKDDGIGMDNSDLEMAFKEFEVIKNEKSGRVDSFGLGLPLIKHFVECQGGKIASTSQKGVGTTIDIYFPLQKPPRISL